MWKTTKLLILILVLIILIVMGIGHLKRKDEAGGIATLVLLRVSADAIDAYYEKHGMMPAPENRKLPSILLTPENFVEKVSRSSLGNKFSDRNSGKLPVDPFAADKANTTLHVSVSDHGIVKVSGDPLNYIIADDQYIVYSVGPDGDDDLWAYHESQVELNEISYDATNGSLSSGDIFFRIRKIED